MRLGRTEEPLAAPTQPIGSWRAPSIGTSSATTRPNTARPLGPNHRRHHVYALERLDVHINDLHRGLLDTAAALARQLGCLNPDAPVSRTGPPADSSSSWTAEPEPISRLAHDLHHWRFIQGASRSLFSGA